jgi:hypothetical protein
VACVIKGPHYFSNSMVDFNGAYISVTIKSMNVRKKILENNGHNYCVLIVCTINGAIDPDSVCGGPSFSQT